MTQSDDQATPRAERPNEISKMMAQVSQNIAKAEQISQKGTEQAEENIAIASKMKYESQQRAAKLRAVDGENSQI